VPLQSGTDVKILLSVVRAYDVPVRKELDSLEDTGQHQSAGGGRRGGSNLSLQGLDDSSSTSVRMGTSDALKRVDAAMPGEALVRSYVEARFQSDAARTATAAGPNPAWNQQLKLFFRPENNDLSAETLDAVRDHLHIHLFDEVGETSLCPTSTVADLAKGEWRMNLSLYHSLNERLNDKFDDYRWPWTSWKTTAIAPPTSTSASTESGWARWPFPSPACIETPGWRALFACIRRQCCSAMSAPAAGPSLRPRAV